MHSCKEKGNALFLILLAVLLFAALSYASTQTDSGHKTAGQEKNILLAGQIIDYANELSTGIQRVMALNNCTDVQISFEGPALGGTSYANPFAPTNKSCHIFDPAGGSVTYRKLPTEIFTGVQPFWNTTGQIFVGTNVINGLGTGAPELVFLILPLTQTLCSEINRQLEGTTTIPAANGFGWGSFQGVYPINGGTGAGMSPRNDYCASTAGAPPYTLFHVLVIR